jgi:hypothetical protein
LFIPFFREGKETISNLKKQINDLHAKNKKYKTTQGFLKDEISCIEEKLDEIKEFKREIQDLQTETSNLKNKIRDLEEERKVYISKENQLKEEIKLLANNNKKIKSDLKNELNEKIGILKELENLKNNQKIFYDKHENLKSYVENTTSETERINSKLKQVLNEKENMEKKINNLNDELSGLDDLKCKYSELYSDYSTLVKENTQLREELVEKKFSDEDVYKMSDKYEEEIFDLKCDLNIWKQAFIEIAKYKLINYDDSNSEDLVNLDKNYIQNAPLEYKQRAENVITYFKSLIEEENYQTVNLKSLKEALVIEQDKASFMREQLLNELQLRRKIHNRYMSLRGNLRVMCRIRPFLDKENNSLIKKSFIDSFNLSNDTVNINEHQRKKNYEFDYIFNQKSHQHEVYEEVSLLVQSMIQGKNICIIAYGQTCTGKTYTIQGPNKSHPGIAIRSAKELFELIGSELNDSMSSKKNSQQHQQGSKLSLSIIEIYNENIYNLLGDGQPLLSMFENSNGNLVIPELNPIRINNFNEASKLFTLASKLRHTNQTSYNDRSSRSHCIYSFHLKLVNGDKVTRSKLHIIDLAGSERISKSITREDEVTKKEAICINLSLLALANVLNALALKQTHIPYRDSKLTHFLKESLNENFNILLLLHISPNVKDIAETISTLEFGTRIVKICKHKTGRERMVIGTGKESNSNNSINV